MPPKIDSKYDVIIVGAGIGGITAGLYLARAGLKVLMVEQHFQPGGYCTSFKRNGYTFDAGLHALGSCRPNGGQISRMLRELNLDHDIEMIRSDPSDIVITPDVRVDVRNDLNHTIANFQQQFPSESRNIEKFLSFVAHSTFATLYVELKDKTFKELIDGYFKDEHLKQVLLVLLGSLQLPSHMASALSCVILFREYVLDGGYYPTGGMQAFANRLVARFKELGGMFLIYHKVEKIVVERGKVRGAVINKVGFVESRYVVSNADAVQTFSKLIRENHIENNVSSRLQNLIPSTSAFIVFLGLDTKLKGKGYDCGTLWYFQSRDVDRIYMDLVEERLNYKDYVACAFPSFHDERMAPKGCESVYLFIGAPYLTNEFWTNHKEQVAESIIKRAEELFPNLADHIQLQEVATPFTFERYTSNFRGAFRGWAPTVSQINTRLLPQQTEIPGLFLAGHWTTQPGQGGIPMVVYAGRNAARLILKQLKVGAELIEA